jgi:hypothetical protein
VHRLVAVARRRHRCVRNDAGVRRQRACRDESIQALRRCAALAAQLLTYREQQQKDRFCVEDLVRCPSRPARRKPKKAFPDANAPSELFGVACSALLSGELELVRSRLVSKPQPARL